jgi:hypothetical protein
MIAQLMVNADAHKFIVSQKIRDSILPVETVMCDNITEGWGNVLGISSNIWHTHATSNVQDFKYVQLLCCTFGMQLTTHVLQVSRHRPVLL